MTGIGPEFLKLLRGIEWDTLTARDAVDLRAALKEAVDHSNEWFKKLTQDFGAMPAALFGNKVPPPSPTYIEPAKMEDGRPAVEASHPREPKATVRAKITLKRKRGRPPVKRTRPNPITVGGANAEGTSAAQAAKLFENSYISKDGPRVDVPATLPANHPRRGTVLRESSVTPEVDMSDFATVENAMRTGKGLKDVFQ